MSQATFGKSRRALCTDRPGLRRILFVRRGSQKASCLRTTPCPKVFFNSYQISYLGVRKKNQESIIAYTRRLINSKTSTRHPRWDKGILAQKRKMKVNYSCPPWGFVKKEKSGTNAGSNIKLGQ